MWEDYLNLAVSNVNDKYQARRLKAHVRAQLLDRFDETRRAGLSELEAYRAAVDWLGDPNQLSERLATPIKYQHGWLWLLSVAQLILGVGIVAFSLKTESFAALALGRIMALWGMVATGVQTRRNRNVSSHLQLLRWRIHDASRRVPTRDLARMIGVGFGTGLALALVASVPWNLVTANMFHPVFISMFGAVLLCGTVAGLPWVLLRRWLGAGLYIVTLQAWAALSSGIGATVLILWHQGFAPPPLFNWQPEMLLAGGWLFTFAVIRVVSVVATLNDRMLVDFSDDHRSPLF